MDRSMGELVESLVSVKRKSIKDQVFEQLLTQLTSGSWPPGTKLPSEQELCRQLGVSRISIRDAINRLAVLGFVETRHGEGSFAKEISSSTCMDVLLPALIMGQKDIVQVLEYRKIMEVGAVEMAVERITNSDLAQLEAIVIRMEEDPTDEEQFAHDDFEFHMAIARAAKNPLIISVNEIIRSILSNSMEDIVKNLGRRDGRYYHRKILNAMKRRDKEASMEWMREHIVKTIERVHTELNL